MAQCTKALTFERVQDLERVFPDLLYTGGADKGFKYKTSQGQEKVVNDDEVQILIGVSVVYCTRTRTLTLENARQVAGAILQVCDRGRPPSRARTAGLARGARCPRHLIDLLF